MIQSLQVSGLQGGALARANPVNGYYQDPITGEYWYAYTDLATGLIHWYKYSVSAAAYVYALSTRWVVAPKTIEMTVGDTLHIYADFYYVGPQIVAGDDYHIHGAIGNRDGGDGAFDETVNNRVSLTLPKCVSSTRFTDKHVDIPITSALLAGTYAIYIKIIGPGLPLELDKTLSSYYSSAVRIVGIEPVFTEFSILDYSKV